MTQKLYSIILDLYHQSNKDFWLISQETKDEFFAILYGRKVATEYPE